MRYQEIKLVEEIQLDEINMSPSSLQRLAGAIDARAGMEFEMIVPDVGDVDDDGDQEPDRDQDERARDFGSIREFFHDGDHNGRREVERLEQILIDSYLDSDFLSEQKSEAWSENAEDYIRELVERDYEDELREQAKEEVLAQTDEFGTNGEELEDTIQARFRELFDAKVEEIMADMGRDYDEAYDEWDSNGWQDIMMDWQEEWLSHEGIETMWDVYQNYDINWPYWTSSGGDAESNVNDVADDFSRAIGKRVNASTQYHGGEREPNAYVVEPDGSLDAESGDTGLEFVSPPMPIAEMFDDLDKVVRWAMDRGCYTGKQYNTGLHINVSVPGFSMDKLDYIKLAVLLGDEYVLKEFGRLANIYCKPAIGVVKKRIGERPEDVKALLDQMRQHLGSAATKVIHSGATDKYVSINTKGGYIEFRSPGGDWLKDLAASKKVQNTLLRFVVAMDAAIDPEKYREEYLKKLYKLLDPAGGKAAGGKDTIHFFADYVAGKTPKAALRSFIKQAQLERKIAKDPTGGQKYWWRVEKEGRNAPNGAIIEVIATSKQEALSIAASEWRTSIDKLTKADAYPIKPYDSSPVRATVGEPQAIGRQSGTHTYRVFNTTNNQTIGTFQAGPRGDASNPPARAFAQLLAQTGDDERHADFEEIGRERQPAQSPQQQYEIVRTDNGQIMDRFSASSEHEANARLNDYAQHGMHSIPADRLTYRRVQGSSQPAAPTGAGRELVGWSVRLPSGEEVTQIHGIGNNQGDANRIAAEWLRQNGMGVSGEGFEVVPLWREA